ncbi:retrotransposon unclassified [Hordeum vulgare]|nr:retrotransposon unclassified [Hordeum vulgare]
MSPVRDKVSPGAASSAPTGNRPIWKLVWSADAPPKMRHFAWQVSSGSLPTNAEKFRRHIGTSGHCSLCDREEEESFHALLACPNAALMWDTMQLSWPLPNRVDIPCTGSEWLLHLLAESHEHIRSRIIMVLWRIWHLRNELMHGKTIPPVDTSQSFLTSYYNTYQQILLSVEEILKGKTPVLDMRHGEDFQSVPKRKLVWPCPAEQEVALSVDGSFHAVDGSAGSGMILRDSTGAVIFASYRKLFHCNDALESELQAIKEGLKLATEHSQATIILQSDRDEALKMIADASSNRSTYGHLVSDIREYMNIRAIVPVKILREQNRVAHCLANFGRCGDSTACWLGRPPPCIRSLVAEDCNSITME